MNISSIKKNLVVLTSIFCIGAFIAPSASAYTVYKLKENYYAIVCADGQIFSYSGGAGGIGIVGEALCEGHGGIAGGGGGGLNVLPASAEVASASQSCVAGGGRKVDAQTTACTTRIRVNRMELKAREKGSGMATGRRQH